MDSTIDVSVHSSCFPELWREDYLESFRSRRMNHRFHYESPKQAERWLALHEAYSPARRDPDCEATYAAAFKRIAAEFAGQPVEILSLGCGGGQKDLALLNALSAEGCQLSYVPSDVSLSLALTARRRVTEALPAVSIQPLILDLNHTTILPVQARIVAFFGMLPNFEPETILPQLSRSLRPDDFLLVSVNLAPGSDYAAGVQRVLPGYDNLLTRQWLVTALNDAGIDATPEAVAFEIVDTPPLKRIEAAYTFPIDHSIQLEGVPFQFRAGERFRLFFSYRHTPSLLGQLLGQYGLTVQREWIIPSEEEGVFLYGRRKR